MTSYKPEKFWEERLSKNFNLKGVGHRGFSQFYNKYLYAAKSTQLDGILEKFNLDMEELDILDLGSGTGFFIDYYGKFNPKTLKGIDITQKTVEELKNKHPEHEFYRRDIGNEFYIEEKFDIINVFDVLYHITERDRFEQAIENIEEHLKEDGLVFISDSYNDDPAEHVKYRGNLYQEIVSSRENLELVDEIPLYFTLNKHIFGKAPFLGFIDNILAPLYYRLDQKFMTESRSNMQIFVIRKVKNQ